MLDTDSEFDYKNSSLSILNKLTNNDNINRRDISSVDAIYLFYNKFIWFDILLLCEDDTSLHAVDNLTRAWFQFVAYLISETRTSAMTFQTP